MLMLLWGPRQLERGDEEERGGRGGRERDRQTDRQTEWKRGFLLDSKERIPQIALCHVTSNGRLGWMKSSVGLTD